jgi:hypothetical protein
MMDRPTEKIGGVATSGIVGTFNSTVNSLKTTTPNPTPQADDWGIRVDKTCYPNTPPVPEE